MQESKSCALPLGDTPIGNRSIIARKNAIVNQKKKKTVQWLFFISSAYFVREWEILHASVLGGGRDDIRREKES